MITGSYRAGKKHGSWKKFNTDGTLFTLFNYRNGKLIKIDGKKLSESDADIYQETWEPYQY